VFPSASNSDEVLFIGDHAWIGEAANHCANHQHIGFPRGKRFVTTPLFFAVRLKPPGAAVTAALLSSPTVRPALQRPCRGHC
jgi:hypothetical protein